MFTRQFLFEFLSGQRRDLLRRTAGLKVAPILIEARGYAGGRKVSQYLETINKAFHSGGYDRNNALAVRRILNEVVGEAAQTQALMLEVDDSLRVLGLSDVEIGQLLQGLDSYGSS